MNDRRIVTLECGAIVPVASETIETIVLLCISRDQQLHEALPIALLAPARFFAALQKVALNKPPTLDKPETNCELVSLGARLDLTAILQCRVCWTYS